jgi:hypothetical protein
LRDDDDSETMMGRWTFRVGEGTYYTTGRSGSPSGGGGGGCFLVILALAVGLAALLAIPYGLVAVMK